MKVKIIVIIIILLCIFMIYEAIILNRNVKEKQRINYNQTIENVTNNNSENTITINTNIESENKLISDIKIVIDGKVYKANIEESETAQSFTKMLPQEFNMNELNSCGNKRINS